MGEISRHILVMGRVQGVGYRAWLAEQGTQRGLRGWVRNRLAGSVEAVCIGDADAIAGMIAACRDGPAMARVERLHERDATTEELKLASDDFRTLPTV